MNDLESTVKTEELEFQKYSDLILSLNMTYQERRLLNAIVNPEKDAALDDYSTEVSARDINEFVKRFDEDREDIVKTINLLIKDGSEDKTHQDILNDDHLKRYLIGAVRLDRVASALLHPEGTSLNQGTTTMYVDDGLQLEGQKKIDITDFADELISIRAAAVADAGSDVTHLELSAQDNAVKISEKTGIHPALITQLMMQQTGIKTGLSKGTHSLYKEIQTEGYRVQFPDINKTLYFLDDSIPFTIIPEKDEAWTDTAEAFQSTSTMYAMSSSLDKLAFVAAVEPTYRISPYEPKVTAGHAEELYDQFKIDDACRSFIDDTKGSEQPEDMAQTDGKPDGEDPKTMIHDLDERYIEFDKEIDRAIRKMLGSSFADDDGISVTDDEISRIMEAAQFGGVQKHEEFVGLRAEIREMNYTENIEASVLHGLRSKIKDFGLSVRPEQVHMIVNELPALLKRYAHITEPEAQEENPSDTTTIIPKFPPEMDHPGSQASGSAAATTRPADRMDDGAADVIGALLDELSGSTERCLIDEDLWDLAEGEEEFDADDLIVSEEELSGTHAIVPKPPQLVTYDPKVIADDMVALIQRSFTFAGEPVSTDIAENLYVTVANGKGQENYLRLATDIDQIKDPLQYKSKMANAFVDAMMEQAKNMKLSPANDEEAMVQSDLFEAIYNLLGIEVSEPEPPELPSQEEEQEKLEDIAISIETAFKGYGNMEDVELPSTETINEYKEEEGMMADLLLTSCIGKAIKSLKNNAITALREPSEDGPTSQEIVSRILAVNMDYCGMDLAVDVAEALDDIDRVRYEILEEFLGEIDIHTKTLEEYLADVDDFASQTAMNPKETGDRIITLYVAKHEEYKKVLVDEGLKKLANDKDPSFVAAELERIKEHKEAESLFSEHDIKTLTMIALANTRKGKTPLDEIVALIKYGAAGYIEQTEAPLKEVRSIIYASGMNKASQGKVPNIELTMFKDIIGKVSTDIFTQNYIDELGRKYVSTLYSEGAVNLEKKGNARREIHLLHAIMKKHDVPAKQALQRLMLGEVSHIQASGKEKIYGKQVAELPIDEMQRLNDLSRYSLVKSDKGHFSRLVDELWSSYVSKTYANVSDLGEEFAVVEMMDIITGLDNAKNAGIDDDKIASAKEHMWETQYVIRAKQYAERLGTEHGQDQMIELFNDVNRAADFGISKEEISSLRKDMLLFYIGGLKNENRPRPSVFVDGMQALEKALRIRIKTPIYTEGLYELLEEQAAKGNYDNDTIRKLLEKGGSSEGIRKSALQCNAAAIESLDFSKDDMKGRGYTNIGRITKFVEGIRTAEEAGLEHDDSEAIVQDMLAHYMTALKGLVNKDKFSKYGAIVNLISAVKDTKDLGLSKEHATSTVDEMLDSYTSRLREELDDDKSFLEAIGNLEKKLGEINTDAHIKAMENKFADKPYDRLLGGEIIRRGGDVSVVADKLMAHWEQLAYPLFDQTTITEDRPVTNKEIDTIYSLLEELRHIETKETDPSEISRYAMKKEDLEFKLTNLARYSSDNIRIGHVNSYEKSLMELQNYFAEKGNVQDKHTEALKFRIETLYNLSEKKPDGAELEFNIIDCIVSGVTENIYEILAEEGLLENKAGLNLKASKRLIEKGELPANKKCIGEDKIYNTGTIQIGYNEERIISIAYTALPGMTKDDATYNTTLKVVGALDEEDNLKYFCITDKNHPEDKDNDDLTIMKRAINNTVRRLESDQDSNFKSITDIQAYKPF